MTCLEATLGPHFGVDWPGDPDFCLRGWQEQIILDQQLGSRGLPEAVLGRGNLVSLPWKPPRQPALLEGAPPGGAHKQRAQASLT